MTHFRIVEMAAAHIAAVARLRVALLHETGGPLAPEEAAGLLELNERFYRTHLGSPHWQTWVALFGDTVGAVGTLALWERPPYPGNARGLDAYLLNMYTLPRHRRAGAARAILDAALEHARAAGAARMILHATEAGRRIYERVGFEASAAYMELPLAPPAA